MENMPMRLATLLLCAASILPLMAAPVRAQDNPLLAERDRSRPVVLVAPDPRDPVAVEFARRCAEPATRAAFADRQITVFTVLGGRGERDGMALAAAQTAALLAALRLQADGPATMVLIGKDGGIKLRRRSLAVQEIIATIDTMPMRRQEISGR
jgi:hypothetical protein